MNERFSVSAEGVLVESTGDGATRELTVADLAALDVDARKAASLVYQRAMAARRAATHSSPFWKRPVAESEPEKPAAAPTSAPGASLTDDQFNRWLAGGG